MKEAIRLENVSRTFPQRGQRIVAIRELSLSVPVGQRLALVGPDGAGKTTLLRLLAGLLAPDTGRLRVLGRELPAEAAAVQAEIGYLPQRFGLYDDLTVAENLTLWADLYGLAREARRERLATLLQASGLAPFQNRLARELSGGMRQKLALAVVLLRTPPLLLLDEPSVGIDPLSRRELWELTQRLVGPETTIVWSTAYLEEAERCERVLVLQEGRRIADGSPAELRAELAGRVFRLVPGDGRPRPWFLQFWRHPAVVDVAVRGGALRLVTREPGKTAGLAPGLEPVAARLEDAVVARLAALDPPSPPDPELPRPPVRGPEVVIEVKQLARDFGDFRAVDGLTFSVRRGEIFGLLGPNGAGKSTTFRMLCGLLPPSGGRALVLGFDLSRAARHARARIGYMAQRFGLSPDLPVRANLAFAAAAYGLPLWRRRRRIRELAEAFALLPVLERPTHELPPGFRQRLAMAAALVHDPEILFLDEPTSGVDPLARRAFWYRIARLAEAGTTVLVTTHFLDEAEYCDRVLIVDGGRALALGEPARILADTRARHPEVVDLEDAFVALLDERRRARAA